MRTEYLPMAAQSAQEVALFLLSMLAMIAIVCARDIAKERRGAK